MKTIISTETGTTTQARVIPLFEFYELDDAARDRVAREYAEERENDPYFGQYFADAYESEIWECVRYLEMSITGADVKWCYNRWYSADFDCEYRYNDCYDPGYMEPVDDCGICYSMVLRDAWNAHARKLNAINARLELIEQYMDETICNYDYWNCETAADRVYNRLDDTRDGLITAWYEELEAACKDIRGEIENLLRAEWEYYTSEEAARIECEDETAQGYEAHRIDWSGRVFYTDCRKWYTADGELYEQASIDHVCVSIVKAS